MFRDLGPDLVHPGGERRSRAAAAIACWRPQPAPSASRRCSSMAPLLLPSCSFSLLLKSTSLSAPASARAWFRLRRRLDGDVRLLLRGGSGSASAGGGLDAPPPSRRWRRCFHSSTTTVSGDGFASARRETSRREKQVHQSREKKQGRSAGSRRARRGRASAAHFVVFTCRRPSPPLPAQLVHHASSDS